MGVGRATTAAYEKKKGGIYSFIVVYTITGIVIKQNDA